MRQVRALAPLWFGRGPGAVKRGVGEVFDVSDADARSLISRNAVEAVTRPKTAAKMDEALAALLAGNVDAVRARIKDCDDVSLMKLARAAEQRSSIDSALARRINDLEG